MIVSNPERVKNVLILMADKHLGNFVVSLPAIYLLAKFFSDKNVYLVVDESYKEIVENMEGVRCLFLYPRKKLTGSSLFQKTLVFLGFLHKLRGISPDLAIDLEGRHVSSTMTFLTGAPLRVGYSSARRAYYYNRKVNLSSGEKHRMYRYNEIASAVTQVTDDIPFNLKTSPNHKESIRKKLIAEGIEIDKPIVSIHPGAGRYFREWTSTGFAEISDWLLDRGLQVVLIGGSGDIDKIREIRSLMKNHAFDLGAALSLGELIALFEVSCLYIGNDTGPLHIASAVGTLPVVGIFFRPGADKTWYPMTEKSVIIKGDAGCEKCKGRDCQIDFECIKKLTAFEVKQAVEQLIGDHEGIDGKKI